MRALKRLFLYLFVILIVTPLINSAGVLDQIANAQTTGVTPATIIVRLDPSVDNATIRVVRASTLDTNGSEIPSPAGEDINNYETNESDDGVYTIDGIELYCAGAAWTPSDRWFDFEVSAEVEGNAYTPATVRVSCDGTEEVTLLGEDEDTPGLVKIALNFRDCTADDSLSPVPARTRVELEGESGTESPVGSRESGNYRVFTFRDVESGEYRWRAAFQQRLNPGDPTNSDAYEYTGGGSITVRRRTVRVERTLTGAIITPETPRTDSCGAPDGDPYDEEPELEESNTCEQQFNFVGGFLACLFLQIVDDFTNEAIDAVNSMLAIEQGEVNEEGLKTAWSYFRNIASLLLVIIGLAMIIGQAISKE